MRRAIALMLACCFALLGTGAVQYLHQLQHQHEASGIHQSDPWKHQPGKHSDSNCQLCLQLHQPLVAAENQAPSIGVMAIAGMISASADSAITSLPIRHIDCRGPPLPERST
jgi:hypothetical protein